MKVMSKRFLMLCTYSVALLVLAVIPPIGITVHRAGMMLKLHHIAGFVVHAILVWVYFADRHEKPRYWRLLVPFVSFAFGMLIEFTQLFLPYRTGSARDLVQNTLGIGIGWGLVYLAQARDRSLAADD